MQPVFYYLIAAKGGRGKRIERGMTRLVDFRSSRTASRQIITLTVFIYTVINTVEWIDGKCVGCCCKNHRVPNEKIVFYRLILETRVK